MKLRRLGGLELYYHIRNQLGFYNAVGSTAQYVISSRVVEQLGGLEAVTFVALKAVVLRHPIMGVSAIEKKIQNYWWVQLPAIDLREVVQYKTVTGGQQFIEDVHQKSFDRLGELPFWRVVIAEHQNEKTASSAGSEGSHTTDILFEVGFFFHHAIGDGLSGAAFHLDFLDALNGLAADDSASKTPLEVVITPQALQLLPSLEEATSWPLSMMFIGAKFFKALVLGDNDHKRWTGPPVFYSPDNPPKTRLLTLFLDSTASGKVSQLCRRNGTTMTPLLTVLIARHLSTVYPSYSRFLGSIAISLRRFTAIDNRQMVNHVSGVTVHCSTMGERRYISCKYIDWDVVRSCKAVIDDAAKSPTNQIVAMLRFLSDFGGYLKKRVGKNRDYSFELSNIGLVDGGMDRNGTAKFERMVFSQSANVAEAPYVFSVASVKGGDMVIALTWQEGILEEDKAKKVMEALEVELHQLALEEDLQQGG